MREELDAATTSTFTELVKESKLSIAKDAEERFTGVEAKKLLPHSGKMSTETPAREVEGTGFYVDSKPTPVATELGGVSSETSGGAITDEIGFYVDSNPSSGATVPSRSGHEHRKQQEAGIEVTGFYVDVNPATGPTTTYRNEESITTDRMATTTLLGEEDEEVIVYVAPHPRVAKAPARPGLVPSLPSTSILTGTTSTFTSTSNTAEYPGPQPSTNTPTVPQAPSFDSVSFSFAKGNSPSPKKQQPRIRPVFTAGERTKSKAKARKKVARATRRRLERQAMFGSFGAIMSEAQLRGDEEQFGKGRDPKWEERRRGDSDIDWGDTDEDEYGGGPVRFADGMDEVSNGIGAMELDSDIDMDAMKAFVKGMNVNGGRHVTMDDLADEERMMLEDAAGESRGEDGSGDEEGSAVDEEEGEVTDEEALVMAVSRDINTCDSNDDEDNSSDEIDQSPNAGFQARLERLRKNTREKKRVDVYLSAEEDTSDDEFFRRPTRAKEDDDFIAHVEV